MHLIRWQINTAMGVILGSLLCICSSSSFTCQPHYNQVAVAHEGYALPAGQEVCGIKLRLNVLSGMGRYPILQWVQNMVMSNSEMVCALSKHM